jgi:tetratricopeptide (TPR) repeat protein
VTVKLDNPERGGGPEATTNDKGKWAVLGIVDGRWEILFTLEGYVPAMHRMQLPSESARMKPIQITLELAGPPPPPPELMENLDKADKLYQQEKHGEARARYEAARETYTGMEGFDAESEDARTFLSEIHMQIARCYSQEENYEKELEHLDYVLSADPGNENVRMIAAQEAIRGGMMERAKELLDGIKTETVQDPALFFNIAVLFLNQGDQVSAIPYLTRSVEVDPSFVDGYYQRALAYFATQKLDEARADCEKVIELAGDSEQGATAQALIDAIEQSAASAEGQTGS